MSKRTGFTLIEILIVVSIIGMLSSIVLVGLGSFRSRGRDARRAADLRETQNALELYNEKEGSYPTVSSWSDLGAALVAAQIGVTSIADDPLGGSHHYQYGSNGQNYVLAATIEDHNNQILKGDLDDGSAVETFGVSCGSSTDDGQYCIKF